MLPADVDAHANGRKPQLGFTVSHPGLGSGFVDNPMPVGFHTLLFAALSEVSVDGDACAVAFVLSNHDETTEPNIGRVLFGDLSVIPRNGRVVALGLRPENLKDLGDSVRPIIRINVVPSALAPRPVFYTLYGYRFGIKPTHRAWFEFM